MTDHPCPYEYENIAAARSGRWSDRLRMHVKTCAECRETASMARTLQQCALRMASGLIPPASYRLLWLKAQFTRKQERLSRLDRLSLVGIFVAAAVTLIGFALWKWSLVLRWLAGVSGEPGSSVPFFLLSGCAALVWFLTEELFLHEK